MKRQELICHVEASGRRLLREVRGTENEIVDDSEEIPTRRNRTKDRRITTECTGATVASRL